MGLCKYAVAGVDPFMYEIPHKDKKTKAARGSGYRDKWDSWRM